MKEERMVLYTAFEGSRRIASGALAEVALAVKECLDCGEAGPILIFNDKTSEQAEVDLRGTMADVRKRFAKQASSSTSTDASAPPDEETQRRPGRPKLGVVAHEVTLLPRHWDWLNSQ